MWLSLRQPYEQFWDLSPREILLIVNGLRAADEQEQERGLALNHHLAGLISFAFNDPKNMPKYEPSGARSVGAADERAREIEAIEVRAVLQALAGG